MLGEQDFDGILGTVTASDPPNQYLNDQARKPCHGGTP
jgi:hypothetical protein